MITSVTPTLAAGSAASAMPARNELVSRVEASSEANRAPTPSVKLTISADASTQAQATEPARADGAAAPSSSIRMAAPAGDDTETGLSSATKYFDPADADQDGQVSELEQQAYDFDHPPSLAESRLANEELRTYEEVARSGRQA
jgi:hypothetical protein